jgi:orotate phosphoribosyltransferase
VAVEAFAKADVKFQSLTDYATLIQLALEKNIVSAETENLLNSWRENPSVWMQ